ncbi:MAG: enoyl-CoA hydratase/isomerase family protein [Acidimicrobiia bacterium]
MNDIDSGSLLVRQLDGVLTLTLNRPEVRNALDLATRALLVDAVTQADAEDDVRAIVITGTDPAFCGGVDLKDIARARAAGIGPGPNLGDALRSVRTPMLAAVNGSCVTGGLEVALCCDLAVASDKAVFADTHASIGLVPGKGMWGMTAMLAEAIGTQRAKDMSLTGRFVSAQEAWDMGLVSRIVPHDQLMIVVGEAAAKLAALGPGVARAWLDVYDAGAGRSLEERLAIERAARGRLSDTV